MSQQLDGEHRYIDIIVSAGQNEILARYDQTFNETILKKGCDYTLSIDRFRIPMNNIPIFKYAHTVQTNPITHIISYVEDQYSIELEYNSVFSGRTYLTYIPTTPSITDKANPDYWDVWSFDLFIRMVNTALETAFTSLSGLTTLPVGSEHAFFCLEREQNTLSLNAKAAMYDAFIASPIKIWMNQNLWRFFDGIPIKAYNIYLSPLVNGRDVLFLPFDTINNIFEYISTGNYYYKMISDNGFECLAAWNIAKGFYFRSNNLRVRNEIMPTTSIIYDEATAIATQIVNNYVDYNPIICNFDFTFTANSLKPQISQFILNTNYKVMDMVSTENLKNIDIQVFWYDGFNRSYPLYLLPNTSMTIRLVFQQKKSD